MASKPLFAPQDLPEGVIAPERLDRVNATVESLRARLVEEIDIAGAASPAAAMVLAHNQCFIRRCLYFAEAGAGAVAAGYGLASLTIARSLIESIASCIDFAAQVETLLRNGDPARLHAFVHTTAFASAMSLSMEPQEGDAWRTTVRPQIERMNDCRPGISEEYDRLCEDLNPSVFWTWIYFAQHDREAGRVRFPAIAQTDADYLQWMVASVQLLVEFETAVARIEQALSAPVPASW